MKNIKTILFVAAMVAMTATNAFAAAVDAGTPADNTTGYTVDGTLINIDGSTGVDIDSAADATVTAAGAAILESTAGSATVSGATTTTVSAGTGELDLTSTSGDVDINAGTAVTIDSTTTTAITGGTGASMTATTGDVTIAATAGDIVLTGTNLTWNGTAVATTANVSALRDEMISEDSRLRRGIAMVAAMATPMIEEGDTQAIRVTGSNFAGEYGMALGYARRLAEGVQVSVDAATTSDLDEMTSRVSLNYSW